MKLVAQRVVQAGVVPYPATGINAFCYLHPGRTWLGEAPADLGRGQLAAQIVEVEPPIGNRVRSYLEIMAPDTTPPMQLIGAVESGASFLADSGQHPPWRLQHGEVAFVFEAEKALAAQWQVELRMLLGYVLATLGTARKAGGGGGILAGDIFRP